MSESNRQILNPYAGAGDYRKAQLHVHTTYSDGKLTPAEAVGRYKELGFSFVALTDHDRVTRYQELDDAGFVTIPGEENTVVRFFRPLGRHMLRLFVEDHLEGGTAAERMAKTVAAGGVVALCHPTWIGNLGTGQWPARERRSPDFQLLEIFNHHSRLARDLASWHETLRYFGPRHPVWGIAVDDMHTPETLGQAWVMVKVATIDATALRIALLAGAFYATTGARVDLAVEEDGAIKAESLEDGENAFFRFIDQNQRVCYQTRGRVAHFRPLGEEGFIRVEVETKAGQAWSQPFWLLRKV